MDMITNTADEKSGSDKRTEKRKTGDAGEEIACKYLLKKGYKIVERNYLCRSGEIDIIAIDPKSHTLAFIEVKSRNTLAYGLPCQAVNRKKQRRIIASAEYYLLCNPRFNIFKLRFDIVEILRLNEEVYIRHLLNAYTKR